MTDRDQTIESIVDTLIGDFAGGPTQRAHQIAEIGVEKDSVAARLINRLTDMLSWNLAEDAEDAGFVLYERVRRPHFDAWRKKSSGRSRAHDKIPKGSVLLVPRAAEERLDAERAALRAGVRPTKRKAPKRATREANRKAKAK